MIDNVIMNMTAEGYNNGYKTRPFYEEVLRRLLFDKEDFPEYPLGCDNNGNLVWTVGLSEEPSESLEKEMKRFIDAHYHTRFDETLENGNDPLTVFDFEDIARHFAEWGAEHLRDSTKMIDKSPEEAAKAYQEQVIEETKNHIHLPQCTYAEGFEDALHLISDAFIAGWEYRGECEKASVMGDLLNIILKVGAQHNFGFGPDLKQCKDNEDESK